MRTALLHAVGTINMLLGGAPLACALLFLVAGVASCWALQTGEGEER